LPCCFNRKLLPISYNINYFGIKSNIFFIFLFFQILFNKKALYYYYPNPKQYQQINGGRMIDTNSINFGIAKIQQAFSLIQPQAEKLTSEFVKYTDYKQITSSAIEIFMLIICVLLFIPVYKYGKGSEEYYGTNFDELGFVIPTLFLGLFFIILMFCIPIDLHSTIIAISFPEMFTINSLIKN
jgi:hypothetical protein